MNSGTPFDQKHLRRASLLTGLEVRDAEQSLGHVVGLVYDTARLLFGVLLRRDGPTGLTVLPIRNLDWHDPEVLHVKGQARPQAMTEVHRPVTGLPVKVARVRGMAFVHDLFIDPDSSRVASFQLAALPEAQQDAHTVYVPGEEVERRAGKLVVAPQVLIRLTSALHTPRAVA